MKKIIIAGVIALGLFVGVSSASALTAQDVEMLIVALNLDATKAAQLRALVPAAPVFSFTRQLGVGAKGDDVVALQTKVGVSPATGYFGNITKAAVSAYQAQNVISPTGYVGPITLAKLNTAVAVVVTPPTGTVTPPTGITTTGAEGTLTVTQSSAGLPSSIYEGDSKVGILGLKIEAKNSDISIQRIKVDLGTSSTVYNKVINRMYVMDGNTVLASTDLNSDTVVKESNNQYTINLTGFNSVVTKGTVKYLTVAADVNGSVDSTYRSPRVYVIRLYSTLAVRGVDGAGFDQTSGDNTITRSIQISSALSESSTLKTSLNGASPKATTIVASSGTNQNEADKVTGLVFNVKAEKDNIKMTDLTISATGTSVAAEEITTAYLFDGNKEIDNTSVNSASGLATFSNFEVWISKDQTKALTIKFDVRNSISTARTVTVSVDGTTGITAENTKGDDVTSYSGSATAEPLTVQKAGAVYSLVGTPSFTKSPSGGSASASSSFLASFTFDLSAQGSDLQVATSGAFVLGIYVNNVRVGTTSAIYAKPTSGVTQTGSGPYGIADGSSPRFVAEYGFIAPAGVYTPAGGIATVRLESATTDAGTVTYISDTFRTGSQTL